METNKEQIKNPLSEVLDVKKVLKLFEYIEKNTNIPDFEIGRWKIWSMIRVQLSFNLSIPGNEKRKNERVLNIFKAPKGMLSYAFSLLQILLMPSLKKENIDVLVRTGSDARRDKIDGYYKCVFFDDIVKENPDVNYFIMELLGYNHKRLLPTYNKINLFLEGIRLLIPLTRIKQDKKEIIHAKEEIIKELKRIRQGYENPEHIDRVLRFFEFSFESKVRIFLKTKEAYKRLLKKISPKILFIVCAYGFEGIVAAAKELNIKVVEIQHGVIHKYHFGYVYGKHLSKYKEKFAVPDYILTYNKDVNKILVKNSFFQKNQLIATGNPRIDFWKKRFKENENKLYKNIFVALEAEDLNIINFIEETLKILKQRNIDVKFTIKLHPGEDLYAGKLQELKEKYNKSVDILEGDSLNLYEHILESDFHVSITSSTHYESIVLNKPTAVLKLDCWEFMKDFIKEKSAKLISSPEELVELINHTIKRDKVYKNWLKNTIKNSKKYQEEDSIMKNAEAIKNILKGVI